MIKNKIAKKRRFKILLVAPRQNNTTKIDYSYMFPLGIAYISSSLKKAGYEVICLNLNHYDGRVEDIIKRELDKDKYDFVATGNNALGYEITKVILNAVKNHPSQPKTILGGPIITTEPQLVFQSLKPDFGVIGEGEETAVDLLLALEKGKDLKKIKGIEFLDKDGKIFFTGVKEEYGDINSVPWPDFEGLEFEKQLGNQHTNLSYTHNAFDYPRVYPILGSRGCPFHCTFCYHLNKYRQRSLKGVIEELRFAVKKYKINVILFYDECIAVNKERLSELCKEIKKLREEVSWELKWSPQLTVHNVDDEMLKMMRDSGAFILSYGFESFSEPVLKSMTKPINPKMIQDAYYKTLKWGLGVQANFIFGDVAETKETAYETLNWWKKNAKGQIGLSFIQPYPGSEIYQHCLKKGIIKDKAKFIKEEISANHWYNMTEKMSDKEIKQLKKDILLATKKYRVFAKTFSKKETDEKIYEFLIKCPFCKKKITYKNCYVNNKWLYGFPLFCRNCAHRYFVVSFIQRVGYIFYPYIRFIRDYQLKKSKPIE